MKEEKDLLLQNEANGEMLHIEGARMHNLQNVNLEIPRNQLVVITGLSGSGKSSLAFDTIYAEGQRRYMETFSAYARQFIGNLERPDVDRITGLSPVISIEQKTTSRNPRSTVGTITEVYDFLRLLFARASDAYSYNTGKKMVRYSEDQIINLIYKTYENQRIYVLAPLVKGRKGHYRELFDQVLRQGYIKVRVDGKVREIEPRMQLDRYKIHDIEVVVDQIKLDEKSLQRLRNSIRTSLSLGKGLLMVASYDDEKVRHFSKHLMCPDTGLSFDEPEPNTFSFNSPYGACPRCNGLGEVSEIDLNKIFPDKSLSIKKGGIAPLGEYKNNWIFSQMEAIGLRYGFDLNTAVEDIPDEGINTILYGSTDGYKVQKEFMGVTSTYTLNFEGVVNFILNQAQEIAQQKYTEMGRRFPQQNPLPGMRWRTTKKGITLFQN